MKLLIGFSVLLLFTLGNAFSQEFLHPKDQKCMMNPGKGNSHIYIKINFKNNNSKQKVLVDSGCEGSTKELTPPKNSKNLHLSSSGQLIVFYYVDEKLVNKVVEDFDSKSLDISIICDASDKLSCTKSPKAKSFWDWF